MRAREVSEGIFLKKHVRGQIYLESVNNTKNNFKVMRVVYVI